MTFFKATCRLTQQLPTLLLEVVACVLAVMCNNSEQFWYLQCIVGRIQSIRLWGLCVMHVRGHNNVRKDVQMDPTLYRYSSTIMEQNKCWRLLAQKFDWF